MIWWILALWFACGFVSALLIYSRSVTDRGTIQIIDLVTMIIMFFMGTLGLSYILIDTILDWIAEKGNDEIKLW